MDISRRQVLLGGVAAAGSAAVGGGLLSKLLEHHGDPQRAASVEPVFVLVTLYGGNDGLDTVIPYADVAYPAARGATAHGAKDVLALGDGLGLHTSLPKLKVRWDRGEVAIVRGVGYPSPNRSHFRSMDIWQSGVPDRAEPTGWLGRWLDSQRDDPLQAIAVGANVPLALRGARRTAAAVPVGPFQLPGSDALRRSFTAMVAGDGDIARSGRDLLTVAGAVARLPSGSADDVSGGNNLEGAVTGQLAQQLDLVAHGVNGGLPTRVYAVSLGGFDTHAAEQETHARLLGELDSAVDAFYAAVRTRPVVMLVHSEFGRRVALNGSGGTDHGTAAPVFVIGSHVHGGFHGDEPSLTDLDDGDLKTTTDFRSVYASVLAGVLGADPAVAVPKRIEPLPLF